MTEEIKIKPPLVFDGVDRQKYAFRLWMSTLFLWTPSLDQLTRIEARKRRRYLHC